MKSIRIILPIITALVLQSCASHLAGRGARPCAPTPATDSAKVLVRRGLTNEARTLLTACRDEIPGVVRLPIEARSWSKENQPREAAECWRQASLLATDSVTWVGYYWQALLAWSQQDSSVRDSVQAVIRQAGDRAAAGTTYRDNYVAYLAAVSVGDSTADARGDHLFRSYPNDAEVSAFIGNKFWDGLYPIWDNDSAKIPYLQKFIQQYSASDWAIYARRNLIGCYFARKDTTSAIAEAASLVYFNHDSPLALYQAANTLFDLPQAADSVKAWAERAYSSREKLVRPSYYTPPEWALVEQATKAGFPLLLAAVGLKEPPPLPPPQAVGE